MSDVRYRLGFFLGAAVLAATGCSSLELARFAPPGVVKYEDIASEKPPNPAIEAVIEARTESSSKDYPNLSKAPSAKDRPRKLSTAQVNYRIDELATARDAINAEVAAARELAEAETANIIPLPEQRDTLEAQLERDEASALAERKDPPPSADNQ